MGRQVRVLSSGLRNAQSRKSTRAILPLILSSSSLSGGPGDDGAQVSGGGFLLDLAVALAFWTLGCPVGSEARE
jgi:hypothetical protein